MKILITGYDEALLEDVRALDLPAMEFSYIDPRRIAAAGAALHDRDVIVAVLDHETGLDFLARLCSRPGMPPVIALAASSPQGRSLEDYLLLAGLRGAALALPGPIDAAELAMAAVRLAKAEGMGDVERELERRLAW